jgi:leader peptidase (prepilin peptidase) / N-methyltransferase
VAAWAFPVAGLLAAVAHGLLGWALVLIALTDYRAFRIPDQLSLPLIPLGLFTAWWQWPESLWNHLGAAVLGGAALYGLNRAYRRLRGHDGLGMGDVKLTAAAGAWVGLEGLAYVIMLASLFGIASFLVFRPSVSENHDPRRARLAFGCYESFALLAAVLWQLQ